MTVTSTRRRPLWLALGCFLAASSAGAQSLSSGGIAGVVRDSTGAVLPGVTVEASSPALIEKVRGAVTDEQGQYKIVELRPGTYSVTFALAGFNTLKRDGIEVTTGFTATVNGDLPIGALEETVTVSGSSPVVDSHNVRTQNLLSSETLSAIPTNKTFQAFAALTVGVTVSSGGGQDVGGDRGETFATISIHGGDPADQRLLMDGMRYAIPQIRGQAKYYNANQLAVSEVTLETGGASAESESGGIQVNMVPREGGNTFKGTLTANYTNHSLQSHNLDDELRTRGVTSPPLVKDIYDFGGAFGGPVRRNVLWFFGSVRDWGTARNAAGNYFNATPHTLFYTPDYDRPAYTDIYNRDGSMRLTWQAAQKHKVTFSSSFQSNCICYFQIENNRAPEATNHEDYGPVALTQATWTYPATNRLLFQAGMTQGVNEELHGRVEGVSRTDIAVQDLATGYFYGARAGVSVVDYQTTRNPQVNGRLSASYVTGSHALKVGFGFMKGQVEAGLDLNTPPLLYQFRNRVPVSITYFASPSYYISKMFTYGVYVQDQWTIGRLTLNPGVRFDRIHAWNPAQSRPAGMYVDAISFPEGDNVSNWRDVVPRLGVAYDPRGDGKTAIKGFIGKFVGQESLGLAAATNGSNSVVQQASRTWSDANGDYVPQEVELGPLSNAAFGTVAVNTRYAPELLTGTRPYNWQASASIQREIYPGIGITVGYFRTWYGNFSVTDNQLVTPADYDPYCITAPLDPRLPGGGGTPQCGLYDIKPSAFGPVDNLVSPAANFGKQSQVFNGVDATINARFRRGQLSGGVSTGQTITDNCYSVDSPQQQRPGFCRVVLPFAGQTQVKFSGVVPLPWNSNISGVFQNLPGVAIMANYTATNAEIEPSLGRNLGACGTRPTCTAVATVAIVQPNTIREDRLTQVDLRFTKVFELGKTRLQGMFDAYNIFNANTILGRNDAYGPTWGATDRSSRRAPVQARRSVRFLNAGVRLMPSKRRSTVAILGLALSLAQSGVRGDDDWSRPATREWPLAGGDWHATRYTALTQIDANNVRRVAGAWRAELPLRESQNKVTPIVRDGLLYLPTSTSVRAYNAKTGEEVWSQPTNTQSNRGIVLGDGLVFVGQFDASVVALDARSGKPVWTYRDKVDRGQRITGPPTYANGLVVIGVSGGDWFVRCRIMALDAKTGKEVWSFYTVPSPREKGSDTWPANNDVWKYGGGAVWTFPAVDTELGLVYVETGNAVPPWGGELRPGANLYTCSVLALDLKTGQLRWYQQLLHHDIWEADVSTPLVLYDASIGGRTRKALAVMRTDGLLFLMDRATGAFLQRVEERPVKQNAQLKTWPTQPFPVTADRIGPECVPRDTVPEGFLLGCHYDPILPDVPNLTVPYMNTRFSPMSYSPKTGNLYATGCVYPFWVRRPDEPWLGFGPIVGHIPGQKSYGILAALDGRTGKIVWQKRLPYPSCGGSGTLVTATGLLFTGDPGGNFQAYDEKSGGLIWQFQTGSAGPWSPALGPGTGPAISYEIDGEQYLAFTIDRAIWAFKIGGPLGARPAPEPLPSVEPFRGAVRETDKITLAAMVGETNPATGRRYEWKSEHAVNPARAQVAVASAVTWMNSGSLTHTIVAEDRSWTTGPIQPGASASVTFTKPGTFTYICSDHPWSISQLIVEP